MPRLDRLRAMNRIRSLALWTLLLASPACAGSDEVSRRGEATASSVGARPGEPAGTAVAIPGLAEETSLPDLTLPDLKGELRPLRSGVAEVTVINFWATWCVPCLKEIPELVALQHKWAGHGVRVVGIAVDSGDPADIEAFAAAHQMEYSLFTVRQGWGRRHLGVFGLPVTLVVDREGTVRRRLIGPHTLAQFEAAIRPYL